ncbi:MAG TPA: ABC transporter substrate-binding protein [Xanthobacteraceae bacterium]|jgi:ABC-type nitrate/sulfonate/bicarbonate transport system substrate-binding protein
MIRQFGRCFILGIFLASAALATGAAWAQTTLRVGKAQPNQFAFVPVDIGVEIGAFAKRGLAVEISAFGGDARMIQALTAGGIDIALGGGPALAALAKGAPAKAVAALANEPNTIMLVVLKDGPIKSIADLRGRRVSVSTAGSLTYWLTQQLSRSQGWGVDGIAITPLGAAAAEVAALKTHQVDAVVTDSVTIYQLVEEGVGRILVKFGERIADFHVHVIYAGNRLIDRNPDALKGFLAGWFDAIAFMQEHKRQAIEIAAKRTGVSETVATEGYDDTMPIFSRTGRFNPKALDVLASSFVEMKVLPAKPEMASLITEAYLPR